MEKRIGKFAFASMLFFSCVLRGWAENGQNFSGTLPVIYIQTESPVNSKEDYVSGSCYIDAMAEDEYQSLGTIDNQIPLQIKGQGNYTWKSFDKKPYHLKFDKKVDPLGMAKSRHFVLIANADDNLAFLRNTVGFELSRRIGLAYTPRQVPVEVVLNDDYIGLYMLTENIRVEQNRVNIELQHDMENEPEYITGGWLIEIDNYGEEGQVVISECNGQWLRFSMHSPEFLSAEQRSYITTLLEKTNTAIYSVDKNNQEWEKYIDIDSLARFYIVHEILDNIESFHGSCYLHKQSGTDTKLIFGPVWDFGYSLQRSCNKLIFQDVPLHQHWISEIYMYPRFQKLVIELWSQFLKGENYNLNTYIDDFVSLIGEASVCDYKRWPQYGTSNIEERKEEFKRCMIEKVTFLCDEWGGNVNDFIPPENRICYSLNGQKIIGSPAVPGIYVRDGKKYVISRR